MTQALYAHMNNKTKKKVTTASQYFTEEYYFCPWGESLCHLKWVSAGV
jgi:hypothetical protein